MGRQNGGAAMLEINNCCKSFGNQTVLQDVSMTIPNGSIIGVSGASGIGKSTLAKILCGVTAPDAGAVFLDGKLLVSQKEAYDRKCGLAIQMVYQQPYATLDPAQKIGAGLRELISYHRLTKNRQETEKLIADILAQMQLPSKILAHLPRQISGGEAQRVALARCLLLSPKLLILDEATSMLDVSTQANLLALVKAQMVSGGGSVLFISHDRALTDFYCDTVYAFDEDHRLKEVRA
jgi:ABC-type dipeptide/oligopeptide/nickel transport system ATPase subunit